MTEYDGAGVESDLITWREGKVLAGGSRPPTDKTLRDWIKKGNWPQPIRMGERMIRFSRSECLAAIEQRKAARSRRPGSTAA
jgi:predicted DNA-binding transcriptional regulator AlpA